MVQQPEQQPARSRRRRRAVGPPGSVPDRDPDTGPVPQRPAEPDDDDVERLSRDRPPHHDRGV